jgi:hypothetical protein
MSAARALKAGDIGRAQFQCMLINIEPSTATRQTLPVSIFQVDPSE